MRTIISLDTDNLLGQHSQLERMGCIGSKQNFTAESGTEAEYKSKFEEKDVLGQGEFGLVKLVRKRDAPDSEPDCAAKVLNKGFVFKDNILYPPMKPEDLSMEIDILRALNGEVFNLKLDSVYESLSKIYVVTEICTGYVSLMLLSIE